MINGKSVVVIVHARGGSKRIPLKNIKPLLGKPLVVWTIEAALKSKYIDRTIVSTDHPEIIRVSREAGAEVPFVRPADISEDVASELVTQHAVNWLEKEDQYTVDIPITMQPTTPYVLPADLDAALEQFEKDGGDSVISMSPIHERPEWMYAKEEGARAKSLYKHIISGDLGISQKLPPLFIPNGSFYITRKDVLMRQNMILGNDVRMFVMPRDRSVDIDDPIDFLIAEAAGKWLREQKLIT